MSKGIRIYLAAYNFTAYALWAFFLLGYAQAGFELNERNIWLLNMAQGMAALEILHAILKWVKSPVLSTGAQVLSRLLVLVLIDAYFFKWVILPSARAISFMNIGIILALMAWSITELVRYGLYFLNLINRHPSWLLWLRYSLFIVLYPVGVIGEWLIIIFIFIPTGLALNLNTAVVAVLLAAYAFYFPRLYKYMWSQRKIKLQ